MYFFMSDPFLPGPLQAKLAQVKRFRSGEDSQAFNHSDLLENRAAVSNLYRVRVFIFLILSFVVAVLLAWLATGLDFHFFLQHSPKVAFCLLLLLLIRSGFVSIGALMLVFLPIAVLTSYAVVFPSAQVSEASSGLFVSLPFVRYYTTLAPLLPVSALYGFGLKKASACIAFGVVLLCVSFRESLSSADTVASVFLQGHLGYLGVGFLIQFLPILFLLALDEEARLYHTLLQKSLKDMEDKSRAKTTFISRMSHELRTPLQGLLSSAALLKQTPLNEDQATFISLIDSCGELLLNIMQKILDISRIESGRFETSLQPCSLVDVVSGVMESVSSMASAKGLEIYLHYNLQAKTYDVLADQKHLRGILTNLLGNAIKFTEKGFISVDVSVKPFPSNPEKSVYRFEVIDTGKGIPEKILPDLFEPFTKAHNYHQSEGSGLGLSIVKRFAEILGGKVGVTTALGTGSTFWFEVPLQRLPPGSVSPSPLLLQVPSTTFAALPRVGVYVRSRFLDILLDYFRHWRIPHQVVTDPADLWQYSHLVVEEHPLTITGPENFLAFPHRDTLRMVFLTTFSSHHRLRTLFEQHGFAENVTVILPPLTPLKISRATQTLLELHSSSFQRLMPAGINSHATSSSNEDAGQSRSERNSKPSVRQVKSYDPLSVALPALDVLLVEDNPVNQLVMRKLFERLGITFSITAAAEEALTIWEHNLGGISLVLMDVELDGPMTGLEATALIRAKERQYPQRPRSFVAIMTGRSLEEDRREAFEKGCDEFLVKPVTLDTVKDLIDRFTEAS